MIERTFCKNGQKAISGEVRVNTEAATRFREELLSDKVLYDAFTASIASVLKEIPIGTDLCDAAKAVADRIVGQ